LIFITIRKAWHGLAWRGQVGHGKAWQGLTTADRGYSSDFLLVSLDITWQGTARSGTAWRGEAGQGKDPKGYFLSTKGKR